MKFYKMHGCGNDFIVMDDAHFEDEAELARILCEPKLGIGADGLILVKQNPLEMVIYNQDGSKASMCGNGIRCFARYVYEQGYVKKKKFDVVTLSGLMRVEITSTNPFQCKIGMGQPIFQNSMMHLADMVDSFGRLLTIDSHRLTIYCLLMGTIHTVLFVDSMSSGLLKLASQIATHPLFRAGTNVDFVHVIDENTIEMRTYERGVGWTLACGTGAVASVITAHRLGLLNQEVLVHLPKGDLRVEIDKKNNAYLIGPATISFVGDTKEINIC